MGMMGTSTRTREWKRIGTSDFEGATQFGVVWIRGPCGEHSMSFNNATQLGQWLLDQTAYTIDGEAYEVEETKCLTQAT